MGKHEVKGLLGNPVIRDRALRFCFSCISPASTAAYLRPRLHLGG